MSYHVDRLYAAVSVLAGHGYIKQRLITAFEDNLAALSEEDLPIAVRQKFTDLTHLMNRVSPLNGEGPICASVRKMSVTEAADCAVSIVALYSEALQLGDTDQAVLPLDGDDKQLVPPFLIKSN